MTVRFARSLYDETALRQSVEAFAALATFEIHEEDGAWAVQISDPDPRLGDTVVDAFANHVLFHTAQTSRTGSLA